MFPDIELTECIAHYSEAADGRKILHVNWQWSMWFSSRWLADNMPKASGEVAADGQHFVRFPHPDQPLPFGIPGEADTLVLGTLAEVQAMLDEAGSFTACDEREAFPRVSFVQILEGSTPNSEWEWDTWVCSYWLGHGIKAAREQETNDGRLFTRLHDTFPKEEHLMVLGSIEDARGKVEAAMSGYIRGPASLDQCSNCGHLRQLRAERMAKRMKRYDERYPENG